MTRILRRLAPIFFVLLCCIGYNAPASAQVTRAWVSGVGDDVNPCSRTAPCKTFYGAYAKTANGGEIVCLDGGGYGGLTIAKSLTIHCPYTEGGILVASTNAITINAPGAVVVISGIDIEGLGQTGSPGLNGISVINVGTLHVRNVRIAGFRNGYGINFTPNTSGAQLVVDEVAISESGGTAYPTTSGGINLAPQAGVSAVATILNTRISNNLNVGIRVDTVGNVGAAIDATIVGSSIVNNTNGIAVKVPAATGTARFVLQDSVVSLNSAYGIIANAGTVGTMNAYVGNTTISSNATGIQLIGVGKLNSFGDNRVINNTTNGAFSATVAKQ